MRNVAVFLCVSGLILGERLCHAFIPGPDLIPWRSDKWAFELSGGAVPDGDEWSQGQEGIGWQHLWFDDTAWTQGFPLNNTCPKNDATVAYARQTVHVEKWKRIAYPKVHISIKTKEDVGAIVYISGVQVLSTNMPDIIPELPNTATTALSSGSEVDASAIANSLMFENGDTLVSVELHSAPGTRCPAQGFDIKVTFGDVLIQNVQLSGGGSTPTKVDSGSARTGTQKLPLNKNTQWTYLDDGTDQGTSWRQPGFNDDSWSLGSGVMGYGEGDEDTVVNCCAPNSNTKYITTYFRTQFSTTPADFDYLAININFDDGIVVYLNGAEVSRSGMPSGSISYTTLANGGSTQQFSDFVIQASSLNNGVNTIAVEVHQRSTGSSDIRLVLTGVAVSNDATRLPLTSTTTWKFDDSGTARNGNDWRQYNYSDASWSYGTGLMGYGDDDITTTVSYGGDSDFKHITTYFRVKFSAEKDEVDTIELSYVFDDGIVIYVNGVEVVRNELPDGLITFNTLANDGSSRSSSTFSVPSSYLNEFGDNIIAVELHQVNSDSSDLAFSLTAVATKAPLFPIDSFWRYDDSGSDLSNNNAWTLPSYNHSSWSNGKGPLGYGNGDEETVVSYGPDSQNKHITTYFRKRFAMDVDVSTLNCTSRSYTIRLTVDDGAAVYVNGVEAFRLNVPGLGPLNASTLAVSSVGGSTEYQLHSKTLPPEMFNEQGVNVIAVEVHQYSSTSSDIRFGLDLSLSTCGCPSNNAADIIRGPYLQLLKSDSVLIRWDTMDSSNSIVYYGTNRNSLVKNSTDSITTCGPGRTRHEVKLSGLAADTTYYYSVENSDAIHSFTTHKNHKDIERSLIWFLGDPGTANSNQRAVRDAYMAAFPLPDVMVLGGDNAYNEGTEPQYQAACFDAYSEILSSVATYATFGNHDGRSANSDLENGVYYDVFTLPDQGQANKPDSGEPSGTEAYYSFDHGLVHFICLDAYDTDRSSNGAMANWLRKDLAKLNATQWTIVFYHHPPYSKGSHDSDTESRLVDMRTVFSPILESAGVDMVLSGHSHSYERSYFINGHYGLASSFNGGHIVKAGAGASSNPYTKAKASTESLGTVYVVAGSAGKTSGGNLNHPAMVKNINVLGSLVIEATATKLNSTFLSYEGVVHDNFIITKPELQLEEPHCNCPLVRGRRYLDGEVSRNPE